MTWIVLGLNPSPISLKVRAAQIRQAHVPEFGKQELFDVRALSRGELAVNPTPGLEMPAVRGGRDRIADPTEAVALLEALPEELRPLWATAFYAGLRRGELQALRWSHVDLAAGVLHVQHGWDEKEGQIATKGKNRRRVPIASVLRDYLLEHRLRSDRDVDALVFGIPGEPVPPGHATA